MMLENEKTVVNNIKCNNNNIQNRRVVHFT